MPCECLACDGGGVRGGRRTGLDRRNSSLRRINQVGYCARKFAGFTELWSLDCVLSSALTCHPPLLTSTRQFFHLSLWRDPFLRSCSLFTFHVFMCSFLRLSLSVLPCTPLFYSAANSICTTPSRCSSYTHIPELSKNRTTLPSASGYCGSLLLQSTE